MRRSDNLTSFRIIQPCIFEEKTQRQGRLSATPLSLAGKHRLPVLRADDEASSFNVRAATSNSEAGFIFVPVDQVDELVRKTNAIPYDTSGAELGHHGDECSFDAIVQKYR